MLGPVVLLGEVSTLLDGVMMSVAVNKAVLDKADASLGVLDSLGTVALAEVVVMSGVVAA